MEPCYVPFFLKESIYLCYVPAIPPVAARTWVLLDSIWGLGWPLPCAPLMRVLGFAFRV